MAVSPEKITITDVLEIFQGPVKLVEHVFKKRHCPEIKMCKLKKKTDHIEKFVKSELDAITIASIL